MINVKTKEKNQTEKQKNKKNLQINRLSSVYIKYKYSV